MITSSRLSKLVAWAFALVSFLALSAESFAAASMAPVAQSPIAGIAFDDKPLSLPVQRNFQMAMLTASSELGRSCGRMEAYGWRMGGNEQARVNRVFNTTVDHLRGQGFDVESKVANTVSKDVTLFTADRSDKHLIFLWSAGEIGLVVVLCETSSPLSPVMGLTSKEAAQPATLPNPMPMAQAARPLSPLAERVSSPTQLSRTGKVSFADFSPVGAWRGTYVCTQGTTGVTIQIDRVKGDQFEGVFSFYPTPKNPYVPTGKYAIYGQYDRDSQRILMNPGKWIQRPPSYYNTIVIGSFDPSNNSFSGFFQGITGCTSIEAKLDGKAERLAPHMEKPVAKSKVMTKLVPKKKNVPIKKAKKPAKPKLVKKKKEAKLPVADEKVDALSAYPAASVPATVPTPKDAKSALPSGIVIGLPPAPAGK